MEWFLKLGFEACLIKTPLFLSLQISITLCFLSTRRNLWFQGIFFPPVIQSHSLMPLLEPNTPNLAPCHLYLQVVLLPWRFLLFLQMFSDTLTNYLKHFGSFFWSHKWSYFHSPFLQMILMFPEHIYLLRLLPHIHQCVCVSNQPSTSLGYWTLLWVLMTRRSKRCLVSTQGPSCCKIPIFHAFLESLSSSYAPGSRHFPKFSFAIVWRRGQLRDCGITMP